MSSSLHSKCTLAWPLSTRLSQLSNDPLPLLPLHQLLLHHLLHPLLLNDRRHEACRPEKYHPQPAWQAQCLQQRHVQWGERLLLTPYPCRHGDVEVNSNHHPRFSSSWGRRQRMKRRQWQQSLGQVLKTDIWQQRRWRWFQGNISAAGTTWRPFLRCQLEGGGIFPPWRANDW